VGGGVDDYVGVVAALLQLELLLLLYLPLVLLLPL